MPIAINFKDIDIILGGHDHGTLMDPILHDMEGTTWVIQSGSFWQNISKIEMYIQDRKLDSVSINLVSLDATIQEDPETKATVDNITGDLETAFGKTYTTDKFADVEEEFAEVPFNLFANGNHDTPVGKLVTMQVPIQSTTAEHR
jgi:2',3'-cyclic-nucleotide 2'-phosphodiesterase (5'-nucleotidase family)